jgi:heme a synthase
VLEALRADLAKKIGTLTPGQLRAVGAWLGVTAAAVFAMVVLGGVTRLTRSGLSMVEWRPEGSRLPSTDEEWQVEFDKYKQFPEYKLINSVSDDAPPCSRKDDAGRVQRMTLDEFKPIYFMEWFHRMWGRGLGVVFGVPAVAFLAKGMVPPLIRGTVAAAFALGALQGGVGWWMVKSGLEERSKDDYREPRVSAYRLTAHLTTAFAIFSLLTWGALDCFWAAGRAAALAAPAGAAAGAIAKLSTPAALAARVAALGAVGPASLGALALVGATSFAGAFVAGNDAGRAYNDWPMYAGKWIPEEIWDSAKGVRNLFENTATVQFDHRNLAYATIAGIGLLVSRAVRNKVSLPPSVVRAAHSMSGMVTVQVGLGIATLMSYVPVWLGATHQAGALALFTTGLWARHAVRKAMTDAAIVQKVVPIASVAVIGALEDDVRPFQMPSVASSRREHPVTVTMRAVASSLSPR